jgi:hypothetical protein
MTYKCFCQAWSATGGTSKSRPANIEWACEYIELIHQGCRCFLYRSKRATFWSSPPILTSATGQTMLTYTSRVDRLKSSGKFQHSDILHGSILCRRCRKTFDISSDRSPRLSAFRRSSCVSMSGYSLKYWTILMMSWLSLTVKWKFPFICPHLDWHSNERIIIMLKHTHRDIMTKGIIE